MTVKELIAELQKLDQDSNIWIEGAAYGVLWFPIPQRKADAFDVREYATYKIKRGDYIINAG